MDAVIEAARRARARLAEDDARDAEQDSAQTAEKVEKTSDESGTDLDRTGPNSTRQTPFDTSLTLGDVAVAETTEREWYSRKRAAALLGVSVSTIDAMRRRGTLRAHRTAGERGRVLIHPDDLDAAVRGELPVPSEGEA